MKTRPILFSAPMVRAILDGTKTQTRRVCKPCKDLGFGVTLAANEIAGEINRGDLSNSLFGQIGDRLWVRETWQYRKFTSVNDEDGRGIVFAATDQPDTRINNKWRPNIYMPRWASRITLEITGVRVERLNDISIGDVDREGTPANYPSGASKDDYAHLWESINGKGSWNVNPWVWVIEFKRVAA